VEESLHYEEENGASYYAKSMLVIDKAFSEAGDLRREVRKICLLFFRTNSIDDNISETEQIVLG